MKSAHKRELLLVKQNLMTNFSLNLIDNCELINKKDKLSKEYLDWIAIHRQHVFPHQCDVTYEIHVDVNPQKI